MTLMQISLKDFGLNNPYIRAFVPIQDNTYIFIIQWSFYCDCAFLSITDYNDTPIVSGKALVNGLKIRNHDLPYTFYFLQKNGETYEPTLDVISSEFVLFYDDEEVTQ